MFRKFIDSKKSASGRLSGLSIAGVLTTTLALGGLGLALGSAGDMSLQAGAAGVGRSAVDLFKDGQMAMGRGDYRTAADAFRRATEKNDGHIQAHLGLARSYYGMGELARARNSYLRVLARDKDNIRALTGLGRVYMGFGAYDRADDFFQRVSKLDPSNVANNYARGDFYLQRFELYGNRNHLVLARDYFNKVIRVNPAHIQALLGLASTATRNHRSDRAEAFLMRAQRVDPNHVDIHAARGRIKSIEALRTADPVRRTALFEEAHRAFSIALQVAPDNHRIEKHLAFIDLYRNNLYKSKVEPGASLPSLNRTLKLLERRPNDHRLNYLAGALYRMTKNDAGAPMAHIQRSLEFTRKALELEPEDSLARFALEETLLANKGQFSSSGDFRRELGRYHFSRANHYRNRNRRERMLQHLRRTLMLDPRHAQARRERLDIFRDQGNYERFLRALIRRRDRNPDDVKLRYRLELALKGRDRSMAYKEGLLSPEGSPGRSTFQRTPARVFIFDFKPDEAFPRHPDAPALIARALNFHLREQGRAAPVSGEFREKVMDEIHKFRARSPFISFGTFYRPEHLARLEDLGGEARDVEIVVGGNYASTPTGLRVDYRVYHRKSGRLLDRFSYQAQGEDAVHEISSRAARRVISKTVMSGRVVKVKPGAVFVNVGAIDGVKKGQRFLAYRDARVYSGRKWGPSRYDAHVFRKYLLDNKIGKMCRVDRVARYVARCIPVNADWNQFHKNDTIVKFDSGKKKKVKM